MKPAAATLFLTAAVLVCGCGPPPSDTSQSPPDERKVPKTAKIICERSGTRVLTPKVEARPDGVHLVIDNRLKGDYGFSVQSPEGGGGGYNAPRGGSKHVLDDAPGEVRIGCYESLRDTEPGYGTLQILEGDSGYKPVELECRGGAAVWGEGGLLAPGAKGEKGDPVKLARHALKDRIRQDDVVELAGYPESKLLKSVRVVREGRVAIVVSYRKEPNGWFEDSTANCAKL